MAKRPHPQFDPEYQPEDQPEPGLMNLNDADEDDLMLLPFVGPRRAQALMVYRPFRSWSEVAMCPGFDRKMIGFMQKYFFIK